MKGEYMRQSRLLAPLNGLQVRDSGAGDGSYTISALPIVFNQWSLPLGYSGFYERIAPGATKNALEGDPHIVSVWDHDTRYTLGTTKNRTLDLTEVSEGVRAWTRVAPTSYAADLRVLLDRGDIDQCSFAFTIERETWTYVEVDGAVSRIEVTVEDIPEIFDVTVCAMGAYPDTSAVVTDSFRSSRDRLESALREGRVDGLTLDGALERGLLPTLGSVTEDPEAAPGPPAAEASRAFARTSADAVSATARAANAYTQTARALLP